LPLSGPHAPRSHLRKTTRTEYTQTPITSAQRWYQDSNQRECPLNGFFKPGNQDRWYDSKHTPPIQLIPCKTTNCKQIAAIRRPQMARKW